MGEARRKTGFICKGCREHVLRGQPGSRKARSERNIPDTSRIDGSVPATKAGIKGRAGDLERKVGETGLANRMNPEVGS